MFSTYQFKFALTISLSLSILSPVMAQQREHACFGVFESEIGLVHEKPIESLLKKLVKIKEQRRAVIDGKYIADLWVEYELNRLPHHPILPPTKLYSHFRYHLSQLLRDRAKPGETRSFLAVLGKRDRELFEFATKAIENARQNKEPKAIDLGAITKRWAAYAQESSRYKFPNHAQHRTLYRQLVAVLVGEYQDKYAEQFLRSIQQTHPQLFKSIRDWAAERLVMAYPRGNKPKNEQRVQEWVSWFEIHSSAVLLPSREDQPVLYHAISYFVGPTSSLQERESFLEGLHQINRTLYHFAKNLEVNGGDIMKKSPLSLEEVIQSWHFHFLLKNSIKKLIPSRREAPQLQMMIWSYLSDELSAIYKKEFKALLTQYSPALSAYFRYLDQYYRDLKDQGREAGGVESERWAYEWIQYVRTKAENQPIVPTSRSHRNLFLALKKFKNGEPTVEEKKAFLKALKEWDEKLYQFACDYFEFSL